MTRATNCLAVAASAIVLAAAPAGSAAAASVSETFGVKRENALPRQAIKAFTSSPETGHTQQPGDPAPFGGRRHYRNHEASEESDNPNFYVQFLNQDTRRCQEYSTRYSVGRQVARLALGARTLTLSTHLYRPEVFEIVKPRFAKWEFPCTDLMAVHYMIQAVIRTRSGAKPKSVEPAVELNNISNPLFSGYARQNKFAVTRLSYPRKVGRADLSKHLIGFRTTVRTLVLPDYPGEIISSTRKSTKASWVSWL